MQGKSIVDWFDVYNPEHIASYQAFLATGTWPQSFLKATETLLGGNQWPYLIGLKVAKAWALHLAILG